MAEDIRLGLGIETDFTNIEDAKKALASLREEMGRVGSGMKLEVNESDIEKAKLQIKALENSIKEAEKTGGDFSAIYASNLKKVSSEADKTASSIKKVENQTKELDKVAKSGGNGFSSISKTAKLATQDIKGTSTQLDQLKNNLQQGVGQTLAFGAITGITGAVTGALDKVRELDEISTDISIVSGKTANEMEAYKIHAGEASDILGSLSSNYLKASLIYEQQGGEAAYYAQELANATVIAANISNVGTDQMSEYLTATINGFQLLKEKGGEAATYITDVMAKLGAASGSDLSEIATGLTRTANVAREAGFEFEEISTMISLVSEQTRRTPETIGNAFKTMLTTFSQLREAGKDEVNEFTNKVQKAFDLAGITEISVFDNGQLRDAADIFKDIAGQWETLSKEGKALVSESVAGKYQAEVFSSFMNNQERYHDLLDTAYGAAGTSAQQQIIYMDSLKARTAQFGSAWESVSNKIVDSDLFKDVIDQGTKFLKVIAAQESGIQALGVAVAPVVGTLGQMFGGRFVSEAVQNKQLNLLAVNAKSKLKELGLDEEITKELESQYDVGLRIHKIMNSLGADAANNFKEMTAESEKLEESLKASKMTEIELSNYAEKKAIESRASGGTSLFSESALKEDANKVKTSGRVDSSAVDNARKELELAKLKNGEIEKSIGFRFSEAGEVKDITARMRQWVKTSKEYNFESEKSLQKYTELTTKISNLDQNSKLYKKDLSELQTEIQRLANQELATKEETLANLQKEVAEEEKLYDIQARKLVIQDQSRVDSKEVKRLEAEKAANDAGIQGYEQASKKATLATRSVKTLSIAYGSLVPMIASFSAATSGAISKTEALQQSAQSLGTTLLFSGSMPAMIAGLTLTLGSMFMDFSSEAEKAKKVNDELTRSFMSLAESTEKSQGNIRSIESIYRRFEGIDAQAFLDNPENSEETIAEYLEMSRKIAEASPELVKYYDSQGRAIVDLTKKYDDLMEAENLEVDKANGVMADGSDSFLLEYSAKMKKSKGEQITANQELILSENKLKEAQKNGDTSGITKGIREVAESRSKIADLNKTYLETKDLIQASIVQPFIAANSELRKLSENNREAADKIKEFTSTFVNSGNIQNLISTGDTEGAKNLLQNMKMITNEFARLKKDGEDGQAENFLQSLVDSSELGKMAFEEYSDSIDQLTSKMEKQSKILYSTIADSQGQLRLEGSELNKINELENRRAEILYKQKDIQDNTSIFDYDIDSRYKEASQLEKELTKVEQKLSDSYKTYSEYNISLGKVRDSFEKASGSAKGFNESLEQVTNVEKIKDIGKEISKALEVGENPVNVFDTSEFEEIKNQFPEIAESMRISATEGQESFTSMLKNIEDYQDSAVQGMMANNAEFFTEWKAVNKSQVDLANEKYGIDVNQATTLAEYKALLATADLDMLRELVQLKAEEEGKLTKEMADEEEKRYSVSATFRSIAEADFLSFGEKTKAYVLSIGDFLDTLLKGVYETIDGWLVSIGDGLASIAEKMGIIEKKAKDPNTKQQTILGAMADNIDTNNSGRYLDKKKKEEAARLKSEQEERAKLIEELLKGNGDVSNFNLAQGKGFLNSVPLPSLKDSTEEDRDTGDKDSDKDKVKDLEIELDRYYKLNNILSKIQTQFENLARKKDAAYGQDRLNIMKQEQDLLLQQSATLNQYVSALGQEQNELRNSLSGKGFSFDGNQDISNLNEMLSSMTSQANSLTGDAKQEAIDRVKEVQKLTSRYTEVTFNLIPDKKKAIEEAKRTFSQIAREKVEYTVKLRLDKTELTNSVLDTVKEMQDSFDKLDEKSRLIGKQMASSLDDIGYYQNLMNQVRNDSSLTDSDREELLKQYNQSLLQAVSKSRASYKELIEAQKQFVSESIEAIETISSRYDKVIEKASTLIQKNQELYGTKGYNQVSQLYKTQGEALDSQLLSLQNAQKTLINYRNSLDKNTDSWKEANEAVNKMGESIEQNLIKKMDLLKEQFNSFSENIFKSFDKMYGTWGFDGAISDFDKLIEQQNTFMNGYQKMTTIGSKIKEINKEIAGTNDPQRAAELAKIRDKEFSTLLNSEKVSKDDYERALKLYEIKQKELAIQERQNASRVAQLVRDENGNMSYEYVRKETEDTKNDLAELDKMKNDLYEFDSKKVQESSKKIFDIVQGYQTKLKELESKGLSPEEYKKELEKLLSGTKAEIDAQQAIVDKWLKNVGTDGMDNLLGMFKNGTITAEQLGIDKGLLDDINQGLQSGSLSIEDMLAGNFEDFANSIGANKDVVSKALSSLMETIMGDNYIVAKEMQNASNLWTSTANKNVTELGNAYEKYMSQAKDTLNLYNQSTGTLNNLLKDTNDASKQVIKTINEQNKSMQAAKRDTDGASNSVLQLQNRLIGTNGKSGLYGSMVQLKIEMNERLQPSMIQTGGVTDILSGKTFNSGNQYNYMANQAKYAYERTVAFTDKQTNVALGQFDTISSKTNNIGEKFTKMGANADTARNKTINLIDTLNKIPGFENIKTPSVNGSGGGSRNVQSFDTGGYTGTWSNSTNNAEGRLAMLHEKELVLDKNDTKNILEAVGLQKTLASMFSNARVASKQVVSNMSETITNNNSNMKSTNIKQPVTINATFPDVTDRREIQAAFSGLQSKAATFIGKTE